MIENIEVFTQNSIRIKKGNRTIYIDPFQMKEEPHDADYILITHDHYDHFSLEDIGKAANNETVLIVPEKMEGKAQEASGLVKCIVTVKPGVCQEVEELEFETVPAYNTLKPFHPKSAGWVGYILQIGGETHLYLRRYGCYGRSKGGSVQHCADTDWRHLYNGCERSGRACEQHTAGRCDSDALWQHCGEAL